MFVVFGVCLWASVSVYSLDIFRGCDLGSVGRRHSDGTMCRARVQATEQFPRHTIYSLIVRCPLYRANLHFSFSSEMCLPKKPNVRTFKSSICETNMQQILFWLNQTKRTLNWNYHIVSVCVCGYWRSQYATKPSIHPHYDDILFSSRHFHLHTHVVLAELQETQHNHTALTTERIELKNSFGRRGRWVTTTKVWKKAHGPRGKEWSKRFSLAH